MINHIITEYPNIKGFIQPKLIEKCNSEGMSTDEVRFLVSLEAKHFYKPSMLYQSQHILLVGLIVPFVLLKEGLVYVHQKEGLVYVYQREGLVYYIKEFTFRITDADWFFYINLV